MTPSEEARCARCGHISEDHTIETRTSTDGIRFSDPTIRLIRCFACTNCPAYVPPAEQEAGK